MKRKLALLMAAIMTVAMVPTTAFASTKLTAVDEITTAVDKIFTSRVELKKSNDQVNIITGEGHFDVYATLTNGKFARVGDDSDNKYQMDSVTGPAHYDAESGIVAVEVISDTKAKVTLDEVRFNQNDDYFAQTWKADWKAVAANVNDTETAWKADATNKADVKAAWLAEDADLAAIEAAWKADADNIADVETAWKADATNKAAVKDAWKADATNKADVESAWKADATNKADVKDAWIAVWVADPTNIAQVTSDLGHAPDATELNTAAETAYDATAEAAALEAAYTPAVEAAALEAAYTPAIEAAALEAAYTPAIEAAALEAAYTASVATTAIDEEYALVEAAELEAAYTPAVEEVALNAAADAAFVAANPDYAGACVLPIIAKSVATGDVVVKFTSNITAFKSASEVIATAVDGDADVAIDGVTTFVEDGDDEKNLKDITIDELTPATLAGSEITLKLKGDWEYTGVKPTVEFLNQTLVKDVDYTVASDSDDEMSITFTTAGKTKLINDGILTKITISDLEIKTTKKCNSGDVATITVSSKDFDSVKLEAAKMVEEAVTYSVEDKTLPTIWAGKNYAIDDETNTLKISVQENQGDILNTSRKATFTFPEGIEVVDIPAASRKGLTNAGFKYEIDENVVTIYNYSKGASEDNKVDMSLKFILNAAPTFSGDVTVTLGGQFDDTSFKVAKVKAPYTVEAKTSEVLIDYRYVPVNDIVITEAEDGILKEDDKIVLAVEKMNFEDAGDIKVTEGDIDVDVDVDSKGDAELYEDKDADYLVVTVKDESTEASTIVISGLELYLDRTLPVGGYALTNVGGTFKDHSKYDKDDVLSEAFSKDAINVLWENSMDVKDIYDYTPDAKAVSNGIFKYKSVTANDEYVDVITAARDHDDSTVTKKIVITVGAATMAAGTETVTLDAPAYINAANYTMLPLRAISEAFNGTVNWDDATKTVTILSGQRIISMTIGSKTMYINGTPVAMNTAPEITASRTFVPVRDLANSLGISNINWTEASGTVTLN